MEKGAAIRALPKLVLARFQNSRKSGELHLATRVGLPS
jgi:hypothetical protein